MNERIVNGLPAVWTDFNARGWSSDDDDCFYVIKLEYISPNVLAPGLKIFAYMDDNETGTKIVGCEATLERYREVWRARPIENTWFDGHAPWTKETI